MGQPNGISTSNTSDYYYQIPNYPNSYSAGTVAGRVVDGLGFRFYWASEGLREEDLNFRPGEDTKSTAETIEHILSLSVMIVDAVLSRPNSRQDWSALSDDEKREKALTNMRDTTELLKSGQREMADYQVIFERPQGTFEYPFWNMLNGPVADAIYHTGQVVMLRRLSRNPLNPNVNVFIGSKRESK